MPLPPVSVAAATLEEVDHEPVKPLLSLEPMAADSEPQQSGKDVVRPAAESSAGTEEASKDPSAPEATEEATEDQEAPEDQEEEAPRKKRKTSLRALVLAELKSSSPADMSERLQSQMAQQDALIAAAREMEAAKQKLVDEALEEVDRLGQAVKEASEREADALAGMKELKKRKKEAAKETAERLKELQQREDMLVLLGFEVERRRKQKEAEASAESEKDAKRQKIEELLQVAEEAKKAQDEMRQREKEARQAVRLLEKEQKQLQLGPFSRRQGASRKAKSTKGSEPEPTGDASKATSAAPVVDLLPVKREGALQPFPSPRISDAPVVIDLLDM